MIAIAAPALRVATVIPRTCVVKRVASCNPAASSFAELILNPDDRRVMAVLNASEERFRFRCTDNDAILVFTVKAILNSLVDRNGRFSKSGEVHFSRKTYSFVIADSMTGFNARLPM
jgi:hypothetical protein